MFQNIAGSAVTDLLTAPRWQAPAEVHIPVGEGWEECDLEKAESGRCAERPLRTWVLNLVLVYIKKSRSKY